MVNLETLGTKERRIRNMGTLLIFIGILCIVAGIMDNRRSRKQSDYNDWVYDKFEKHDWVKKRK